MAFLLALASLVFPPLGAAPADGTIDQSQAPLHERGPGDVRGRTAGPDRQRWLYGDSIGSICTLARRFQRDHLRMFSSDRVRGLPDRHALASATVPLLMSRTRLPDATSSPRPSILPRRSAQASSTPSSSSRAARRARRVLVVVRRRPRVSGRRRPFPQRRELVDLVRQRPGLRVQDLRGHVLPIGRYPQRVPRLRVDGIAPITVSTTCQSGQQAFELDVSIHQGSSFGSTTLTGSAIPPCDGSPHRVRVLVARRRVVRPGDATVDVFLGVFDQVRGDLEATASVSVAPPATRMPCAQRPARYLVRHP